MTKEYSPLYKQYLSIKEEYPEAIVLWQCGDMIEAFDDDAKLVSEICEVPLTDRPQNARYQSATLLAGFSVSLLNDNLPKLVKIGRRVAIVENPSFGAKPINFKRDIGNAKKV